MEENVTLWNQRGPLMSPSLIFILHMKDQRFREFQWLSQWSAADECRGKMTIVVLLLLHRMTHDGTKQRSTSLACIIF